jgi:predicted MFS family arabinose efflux permease
MTADSQGSPPPSEARDAFADEPRNMAAIALSQVIVRIGWVFKTESVIIPAFLDSIAGAGWLRGVLPVANRLGQSLPPFFLSRRIKLVPRKKWVLFFSSLGMAAPFLLLAASLHWQLLEASSWAPVAFLLLYSLFFSLTGIHVLAIGTLQGKLVRADRRGRLLAWATMGGALPAMAFAWWLMPDWLALGMAGWSRVFAFAGACFVLSSLAALPLREAADDWSEPAASMLRQLRGGWEILRRDHDYRRLVVVSALFTSSLILIPHYQALGRERLGLAGGDLMFWVVAQTLSVGTASLFIGPMADRYGNRLSLRIVTFGAAAVPCLALALSRLGPERIGELYTLVFIAIGCIPIGFRITTNYILELAPESEHARYLSLAQICNAAVILSSPLFGLLLDVLGYEPVFLAVTGLILVGGVMTFGLVEPRHQSR